MIKSLFKHSLIYGLSDFLFKFVNFAMFPIYAQYFTVSDYGILSLVTTAMTLVAVLLSCGLGMAVQRFYLDKSLKEEDKPSLVSSGLCCILFFSSLTFTIASIVLYAQKYALFLYFNIEWDLVFLGVIASIFFQIFQYCVDVLRLYFSPWKYTLATSVQNLLLVLLALFFSIALGWGVRGYMVGTLLANACAVPLGLWAVRKDLTKEIRWDLAKEMLKFGYPVMFACIAYWVFGSIDRWMLSEMNSNVEVGLYSVAFKMGTVIIFLCNAFASSWQPHAMKEFSTNSGYRSTFSKVLSLWSYLLVLLAACIGLLGQEALIFLTPPDYWDASHSLIFITLGLALYGTSQVTSIAITLSKKTHYFTWISWLSAGLNVVLNWVFIPSLGAEGAALATLVCYACLTMFYLICSQHLDPIPLETPKLLIVFFMIVTLLIYRSWQNYLDWPWDYTQTMIKGSILLLFIVLGFWSKILDFPFLRAFWRNTQTATS